MNRHTLLRGKTALAMALCAAACSQFSSAQVAPPVILQIDLTNNVLYFQDTSDISKYATEPNVTPPAISFRNFYRVEGFADIVAVNGQPMKGTYANAAAATVLRTAPTPGQALADTVRQAITVTTFEILKSDGTSIGTIVASGLFAGDAPPGSPTAAAGGNFVITGGTGAFLGARGQLSVAAAAPGVVTQRNASITEDPGNRRRTGGGSAMDRPLDPNGAPRSDNAPGGSGHHPFRRLLSRHCVQAGSARGDLIALCDRPWPGESGS